MLQVGGLRLNEPVGPAARGIFYATPAGVAVRARPKQYRHVLLTEIGITFVRRFRKPVTRSWPEIKQVRAFGEILSWKHLPEVVMALLSQSTSGVVKTLAIYFDGVDGPRVGGEIGRISMRTNKERLVEDLELLRLLPESYSEIAARAQ